MSTQRRFSLPSPGKLSHSQRGTLFAYIAVIVLFIIGGIYRPSFIQPSNIGILLLLASFVGITAAGQTFVILIGGIDLSVPWTLNAMAVLLTTVSLGLNSRAWWVVPLALLVGSIIGIVNGLGITLFDIPPVVMTLGMNGVMQGLVLGFTNGFTCSSCNSLAPPAIQSAITGLVPGLPAGLLVWVILTIIVDLVLSMTTLGRRIYALGNNLLATYLAGTSARLITIIVYGLSGLFAVTAGIVLAAFGQALGLPTGLLVWVVLAIIVGSVLSMTTLGRRIYALGNNSLATYLAGTNVRLITIIVYGLSGLFAAIAGIALAAFGQQATLGMGDPYLFESIAAVVIGGTSILGGRGNYWGTIAGAIFLVVLSAVLQEYNISEAGRSIASGIVILVALLLYGRERREV